MQSVAVGGQAEAVEHLDLGRIRARVRLLRAEIEMIEMGGAA